MRRSLLLVLGLAIGVIAGAADPAAVRAPGLKVDLRLSEGPEIIAALRFRMDPGWHVYWKNPGDSGLPPEVRWELPDGWTAGPLNFPVPVALPSAEGVDYGHSGTFTLLAQLSAPPGKRPSGTVKASVDWLACREACVQGKAALTAAVGAAANRLGSRERASALARLPLRRHSGLRFGRPFLRKFPDRWVIEVPLSGSRAAMAGPFFPEALPGFAIVHREVRIEGGVLRIPVLPSSPGSHLEMLRGVLRLGGQGVALELPLPRAPAP